MTPVMPRIGIFCSQRVQHSFFTSDEFNWMAKSFEINYFNSDKLINEIKNKFNIFVIIGNDTPFKYLNFTNVPVLRATFDVTGDDIYNFYIDSVAKNKQPVISIFTPVYNTFEKFLRCHDSVISQSYSDWEWIILDDSPNDDNYNYITNIIKNDNRIKVYKSNRQDGFIGSTKKQAASLCNGTYLLELDHDDELHHLALEYVVSSFKKYPDADFCYSNSCEVFEEGGSVNYGSNFAMGYGEHFTYYYKGRKLLGADTPINSSTMRHIVGVPNHLRCWKRDFYNLIQKHNNSLYIVDDYELLIRTFLYTKIVHIPAVLYIQYMNSGGNNTQEPRRAEIQRLVDRIQKYYDSQISARCIEFEGRDRVLESNYKVRRYGERETFAYKYEI